MKEKVNALPWKSVMPALHGIFADKGADLAYRGVATPDTAVTDITVSELLENPVYGQNIRLTGKLARFMGANRYIFADDTGEIVTRISGPVFGDLSIFRTSKIMIRGELKRTLSGLHVLRARTLRVLYF